MLVDLRNNGGGSLSEATDLTGLFIGGSGRAGAQRQRPHRGRTNADIGAGWSGPLAVLINRNSAGVDFAGCVFGPRPRPDHRRPSCGKGTVQESSSLDQVKGNEAVVWRRLKMTIDAVLPRQWRIDAAARVTPDISSRTIDFDQNGEQAFDNTCRGLRSLRPAPAPSANLAAIVR